MPLTHSPKPAGYDLHLHTSWSYDATADAELYFKKAQELGVRCLAITEHHNIDSATENLAIAKKYPDIRFIVAAELTVDTSIGSVDLLCYNLPHHPEGLFKQVLEEYHVWQRAAGDARSRAMLQLGFPYNEAARLALLRTYRPERVIQIQGATHVANGTEAQYFIDQGYFSTAGERREKCATTGIQAPSYPPVERVAESVKQAGGLIAIAHPPHYFLNDDPVRMDSLREECRLDGIECAHPSVSPELTEVYRSYCEKHGLFSTGGSDTHHHNAIANASLETWDKDEKRFADHIGKEIWLDEFLERLDS